MGAELSTKFSKRGLDSISIFRGGVDGKERVTFLGGLP